MGTGASKQFHSSEKAKHAAAVLNAVQEYQEATSPRGQESFNNTGQSSEYEEINVENRESFKKTIFLGKFRK